MSRALSNSSEFSVYMHRLDQIRNDYNRYLESYRKHSTLPLQEKKDDEQEIMGASATRSFFLKWNQVRYLLNQIHYAFSTPQSRGVIERNFEECRNALTAATAFLRDRAKSFYPRVKNPANPEHIDPRAPRLIFTTRHQQRVMEYSALFKKITTYFDQLINNAEISRVISSPLVSDVRDSYEFRVSYLKPHLISLEGRISGQLTDEDIHFLDREFLELDVNFNQIVNAANWYQKNKADFSNFLHIHQACLQKYVDFKIQYNQRGITVKQSEALSFENNSSFVNARTTFSDKITELSRVLDAFYQLNITDYQDQLTACVQQCETAKTAFDSIVETLLVCSKRESELESLSTASPTGATNSTVGRSVTTATSELRASSVSPQRFFSPFSPNASNSAAVSREFADRAAFNENALR